MNRIYSLTQLSVQRVVANQQIMEINRYLGRLEDENSSYGGEETLVEQMSFVMDVFNHHVRILLRYRYVHKEKAIHLTAPFIPS